MASIDSADEAGGESIYSSDGLPSLTAPRAPKLKSNVSTAGEDVLDSNDLIDPATAQSIFTPGRKESPHAKLARLQKEVAELEIEMQGDDVSKLASILASRIGSGINAHDDLTKMITDFKTNQKHNNEVTETAGTTGSSGLVYEIYGGSATSTSSIAEKRILKLEQMLGVANTNTPDITSRLQLLERKMQSVDTKTLDNAATRAKAIRSDLEAASKARAKLTSSSSTADNKVISELHSQLIQLEGLSDHLPALTLRLQQLAHLHVNADNFSSRLTRSEETLASIQGLLANLTLSVTKIEEGIVDNIITMDSNLKNLEERIG